MTTRETCVTSFDELLGQRGVTRRSFLGFCGAIAATLGLSEAMVPQVAQALEGSVIGAASGALKPVVWLELASCTGCTESFAQVDTPDVATVVLELISLNYAETLSAGAGWSLEEAKEQTIKAGGYIVVIEGALMEGWDGNALRIANEKGTDIVAHAVSNADAVVCAGSCAVDGGWQAAHPNPGGAIGIQPFLEKKLAAGEISKIPPLINIPCCPANPEHVVAVLVDVLLLKQVPALNNFNQPALMFNQTIHDNCPRRGHFENGEFVRQFGSEEEKKGYCLYAMGCKGPQTKSNCPIVRWNRRVSWCVEAGAPCAGCATTDPTKQGFNWVDLNTPFLGRFKMLGIGDLVFEPTWAAVAVAGVVVVALVAHGFGMKATGRTKGGAPFELERKWDAKHPDKAIGAATAAKVAATVEATAEVEEPIEEDVEETVAAEVEEAATAEAEEAVDETAEEAATEDAPEEGGDQ
ncbi:MAG: hydrogenase small subunit [Coriobacteriales bacterium]|jgi:hydrogenase small subunit|nr:hydrogenase small subunit [Coriobacteriales bacterium]